MSKNKNSDKEKKVVQTTGHAWDGDIQEFNNPIPTWWLWSFYATVVFAIIYFVLFPAWPVGNDYTKGVLNDIEYVDPDGKTIKTHWNTRSLYEKEMADAAIAQKKFTKDLEGKSSKEIMSNPKPRSYAFSVAKVVFTDNCASCHQPGGAGIVGKYPNLADDDWLWGGNIEQIEKSIREGRTGNMPAFAKRVNSKELDKLSEYILSLSVEGTDKVKATQGKALFQNKGCNGCHGDNAAGNSKFGSANLTDKIWTVKNVPAADTLASKKKLVEDVIENGVKRHMPVWKTRLSDIEIRMLAIYVHEFGGGQTK